ncbi:MAG: ethanolamine utilization protein [Candidatus Dactylopiibacterium carminicum]|uniref:DNA-directed DNA polymerase n=1 Tax=Candidatus Dactylopiibacterium carminicum TaxID=857335 RepID=A0A272ERQ7_9RHOO|nr:exonuclease domain-containing protein [Candidatus Dactylopiibacterium carminicum]KAF7598624.1 ethanolamine utilization protein [Candidatus Dactylopiibacterium carminicum]PAS92390.1 MAG: ethanolamine utilization protein [Candidatus Dactylopiibacterium carminicum]PAS96017.1 MAG: ethanolamine utilization protein [Candidatus Dactylopiibacterium carminicum]PAS98391.1 MAG: hypothetical protein BSR46_12150 [Candidatus Dactylopiibacterium carminicum]
MQLPRLAIVDLETTGADPNRDRITEIAILVTEGERLIEQWSSLVQPGMPIPARIQTLIGITDEMVAQAPEFPALAEQVQRLLADAVFVAHNARFDYNFLRTAFERCGVAWQAPVLCTVKFSRALDPEHPRHGLDALIARGGYEIQSRHRALDDALIVWRFLQDALPRASEERLQKAWDKAFSPASQLPRMPRGNLEGLPDSPGAYVFRSATGQVLEIGRARDLRSQVLGFFTNLRASARQRKLAETVHEVESWPCAGELGAQLQELSLQRSLRGQEASRAYAWALAAPGAESRLQLIELTGSDPVHWGEVFGSFRGEREARTTLQELARQHRLCATRIGLEQGGGPCQAVHLGRCHGVCIGREAEALHDARLLQALTLLRMKAWPVTGVLQVREHHEGSERSQTHIFDHWCWLGSADDEAVLGELLQAPPSRRFDPDIQRLLVRWLAASTSALA